MNVVNASRPHGNRINARPQERSVKCEDILVDNPTNQTVVKGKKGQHREGSVTAERLAKESAIIAEIGRIIGSSLDISEVYERFSAEAAILLPFDRINVDLLMPKEGISRITYVSGLEISNRKQGDSVPIRGTVNEIVMRTRHGVFFDSAGIMERMEEYPNLAVCYQLGLRSIMSVPLFSRDEIIGVLHMRSKKMHAYTEQDLCLAERIGSQIAGAIANAQLFANLKRTATRLQESEEELKRTLVNLEILVKKRTQELMEINTALQVLLKKREEDQKNFERNMQANVEELIKPFMLRLAQTLTNEESQIYLNIVEANLNNLLSPFVNNISTSYKSLTPKEIQIAELIRQGKSSKEIARIFNLSVLTVLTHRNNIRKKLQLNSKNSNLRSHLISQY